MLFSDQIEDEEEKMPDTLSDKADMVGLREPAASPVMIGHDEIEKEFVRLYQENSLPHGLIFTGVGGIGKATMAYRLARFLLVRGIRQAQGGGLFAEADLPEAELTDMAVDMSHPAALKVAAGSHPDLLVLKKDSESVRGDIKVDQAREVPRFLHKTSAEGGWRIVLIDDAEYMNINAQNAILKTLEEPPANTLLILVTLSAARLLPTIRSRCRVVEFKPLQAEIIENLAELDGLEIPEGLDINALAVLSGGRFGLIKERFKPENIEIYRKALELITRQGGFPRADIHNFCDFIALGKHGEYDLLFDWLIGLCERLIQAQARQAVFASVIEGEAIFAEKLENQGAGLDSLYKKWEELKQNYQQTRTANLDRKLSLFNALKTLGDL